LLAEGVGLAGRAVMTPETRGGGGSVADNPSQQLFDLWKRQMEEGAQAWLKMMGQSAPAASAPDLTAFWRPFLDQSMAAWAKVLTQGAASPEMMTQWKQFLDQWIAAWARVLEQSMGTEAFARVLGKQLEASLNVADPARKAAEQYIESTLASIGLPSRSQVVALAKQVVQLEEKIEGLEDRLDAVLERLRQVVPAREMKDRA
jgi:Poly(R)-hydroxyalkanoic acid synthase subunit (PHA_synth_III_E)